MDSDAYPRWPHAPPHWLFEKGSYFVTASAYHREPLFSTAKEKSVVVNALVETAAEFGWQLRAWVVLHNHYHFLADSPAVGGQSLEGWLREFHRRSAVELNRLAGTEGRRVWMNYRDSLITHQTSYLARLQYIHQNPVRHGLVRVAGEYLWSSLRWFETNAPEAFMKSVGRFKTDQVKVWDDFD